MKDCNKLLSLAESQSLRGIAILAIMLHNYCHWLGFAVKENEFTFDASRPQQILGQMMAPDANIFVHLMSFFGHYGVPVFLFISGFGLVCKYEKPSAPGIGILPFTRYHYLKLFKMMFVGFVAFTIIDYITPGRHYYEAIDIVALMGMFINILPNPDRIIWPGPYWFFGLMIQLYVIWRLVLYRRPSRNVIILVVLCWLLQAFLTSSNDPGGVVLNRVRYNFIGGMLPFGLGVLYARHGKAFGKRAYIAILLLSVLLVVVASLTFQSWLWVPLFIVTGSVALIKLLPQRVSGVCMWLGAISSAMFVTHPILRKIFIPLSRHGEVYAGLLLYVMASVCVAWLFAQLMRRLPEPRQ